MNRRTENKKNTPKGIETNINNEDHDFCIKSFTPEHARLDDPDFPCDDCRSCHNI